MLPESQGLEPLQWKPAAALRLIPPTRYQGSKRKLCPWIRSCIECLEFETALDAFGGTGSVAYMLKGLGKRVTYNDSLRSNEQVALALVENDRVRLDEAAVDRLLAVGADSLPDDPHATRRSHDSAHARYVDDSIVDRWPCDSTGDRPPRDLAVDRRSDCLVDPAAGGNGGHGRANFIAETFHGIYFTASENAWLDRICCGIRRIGNRYERSVAWYALFQAALAKRPYNLFHRRNLYMRTASVARSFGNKTTWDRPFEEHFRRFARLAAAAVIDGQGSCRVRCGDVSELGEANDLHDKAGNFDLVYIDPPYINRRGVGVDYGHFYHFLEGMVDYDRWPSRIDWSTRHRRLVAQPSPWTNARQIHGALDELLGRLRRAIVVLSYRSDGIPSIAELAALLRRHGHSVTIHENTRYQYALSKNRNSKETILIGR